MIEILEKLKKTIYQSIQFGEYKVLNYECVNGWERIEVEIDEQKLIIGLFKSRSVVFHNLETISEMLTADEQKQICLEFEMIEEQLKSYKIAN